MNRFVPRDGFQLACGDWNDEDGGIATILVIAAKAAIHSLKNAKDWNDENE